MTYFINSLINLTLTVSLRPLAGSKALRATLLSGAPGTGKTALAEAVAEAWGAELVFGQLHDWSSSDDAYSGVNVAAAVAGNGDQAVVPGLLLKAAIASQSRRVVLVIDEIDKAPQVWDSLLLDFLQSGRVPTPEGGHEVAVGGNLLVFVTTNGQRDLNDALYRRVTHLPLTAPSATVQDAIAQLELGLGAVAELPLPKGVEPITPELVRWWTLPLEAPALALIGESREYRDLCRALCAEVSGGKAVAPEAARLMAAAIQATTFKEVAEMAKAAAYRPDGLARAGGKIGQLSSNIMAIMRRWS